MRFCFALLICCFAPILAQAQLNNLKCDDSARLIQHLKTQNGERIGQGLRDPETVLEIWQLRSQGDWIIVQSYSNGTSCIVAMGEHWMGFEPDPNPV